MLACEPARACPLCGQNNASGPALGYSQPPWRLKQCASCGLVYLENPPAYESLGEEFAWEKTWAEERAQRRRRWPVLYYTSRLLKGIFQRDTLTRWACRYFAPGRILDIGCGAGHSLERLPAQFILFGIEISRGLSRQAEDRFARRGGRVIQADALSGLAQCEPQFFDGVIMTSFLEHEPRPKEVLAAAARVMKPGARLIVKAPNFSSWNRALRGRHWCGFRFPDHVNYFTPELLRRLLAESGFRLVRFGLTDRFPTSDNMWLVAET